MRVATWNVNSVKQRVPRLLPWLDERQPDVVCLQETKLADDAFRGAARRRARRRGYAVALHGEAQWNGVAILSRVGLDDVVLGIAGAPGFPHPEARAVAATCGGIRVHSVYVPNGRVPDSDHYQYKLAWFAALREMVAADPPAHDRVRRHEHRADRRRRVRPGGLRRARPTSRRRAGGPGRAAGARPARRRARALADAARVHVLGLPRRHVPQGPGDAHRPGAGAATRSPSRVRAAWVDRQARKGTVPSDHAPVIVDLDEAPDGDIGPVVPPPSAPAARPNTVTLPQSR